MYLSVCVCVYLLLVLPALDCEYCVCAWACGCALNVHICIHLNSFIHACMELCICIHVALASSKASISDMEVTHLSTNKQHISHSAHTHTQVAIVSSLA
jgi:hypothetical protein